MCRKVTTFMFFILLLIVVVFEVYGDEDLGLGGEIKEVEGVGEVVEEGVSEVVGATADVSEVSADVGGIVSSSADVSEVNAELEEVVGVDRLVRGYERMIEEVRGASGDCKRMGEILREHERVLRELTENLALEGIFADEQVQKRLFSLAESLGQEASVCAGEQAVRTFFEEKL